MTRELLSINQEHPPRGEDKQFQLREPSTFSFPSFADLIIRKVVDTSSPNCLFLQVHVALLMPRSSNNQVTTLSVFLERGEREHSIS